MRLSRSHLTAVLLAVMSIPARGSAQQSARVPIRTVTPASATSPMLGSVDELREIAHRAVLVNDGNGRALITLDSTLQRRTILADTTGLAEPYPRIGKLIPYTGD